jgi:hypothetical protein
MWLLTVVAEMPRASAIFGVGKTPSDKGQYLAFATGQLAGQGGALRLGRAAVSLQHAGGHGRVEVGVMVPAW